MALNLPPPRRCLVSGLPSALAPLVSCSKAAISNCILLTVLRNILIFCFCCLLFLSGNYSFNSTLCNHLRISMLPSKTSDACIRQLTALQDLCSWLRFLSASISVRMKSQTCLVKPPARSEPSVQSLSCFQYHRANGGNSEVLGQRRPTRV